MKETLKKFIAYPRKPQANASEAEIQAWQKQRDYVKAENAKIKAFNEKMSSGNTEDTRSKLKRVQNRK